MNADNYQFFCKLLRERTGLVIGPEKAYLVESRLAPVARRHGLADAEAVLAKLRGAADLVLARETLDAMMTHESFFFRDTHPFEEFRKTVLPAIIERAAAAKKIRIWCAAASTGQEPYSLAMIVREEAARLAGWTVEIVGTDISAGALAYARDGLYTQFEVQRGLPIKLLVKHFAKEGDRWRISPELRAMVAYREFNLLQDPAPLGTFDVVFCRNVLIYFDQATKAAILGRIAQRMTAEGYLYLGGAETVIGLSDRFTPVAGQRGVYAPSLLAPAVAARA